LENGVQVDKPVHYAQIQTYLGLLRTQFPDWLDGEPPETALYVVVCKNNEKLYVETVDFDEEAFLELGLVASEVLQAVEPPERPVLAPDGKVCLWCPFESVCWDAQVPDKVCGTCHNYRLDIVSGRVFCALSYEAVRGFDSCDDYTLSAGLEPAPKVLEW